MWSAIFDSAMRPVVIVLLDPTSDAGPRFFQAAILVLTCPKSSASKFPRSAAIGPTCPYVDGSQKTAMGLGID
jgi:hypothetical protein